MCIHLKARPFSLGIHISASGDPFDASAPKTSSTPSTLPPITSLIKKPIALHPTKHPTVSNTHHGLPSHPTASSGHIPATNGHPGPPHQHPVFTTHTTNLHSLKVLPLLRRGKANHHQKQGHHDYTLKTPLRLILISQTDALGRIEKLAPLLVYPPHYISLQHPKCRHVHSTQTHHTT